MLFSNYVFTWAHHFWTMRPHERRHFHRPHPIDRDSAKRRGYAERPIWTRCALRSTTRRPPMTGVWWLRWSSSSWMAMLIGRKRIGWLCRLRWASRAECRLRPTDRCSSMWLLVASQLNTWALEWRRFARLAMVPWSPLTDYWSFVVWAYCI